MIKVSKLQSLQTIQLQFTVNLNNFYDFKAKQKRI